MESTELKTLLNAMQDELALRREKIHTDFATRHVSKNSGQQTKERENDDVLRALDASAEDELGEIKRALIRSDLPDFQNCQACDKEISDERLQAIPYTTFCRDCADHRSD